MKHFLYFLLLLSVLSCKPDNAVKSGLWRAEVPTVIGVLPFHIEIFNLDNSIKAFTVNDTEKIAFDTAYFANDSLHLKLDIFDAEIVAKVLEGKMTGFLRKKLANLTLREGVFTATLGDKYRFTENEDTQLNISGKYQAVFYEETTQYQAVGVFKQTGNKVTGTFLTATGDYRYLQGNVVKDSLMLSCFDGNHAFLFRAKIQGDSLVGGMFCSNLQYTERWEAIKNDNAELPPANSLTYLKPGFKTIDFKFNDANGKPVSLSDGKFKNKVVIVQVIGSWCPNCMDETKFFANYYDKNKSRGLEIIGLAFEKSTDPSFANPKIEKLRKRFGVNYEILVAGLNEKDDASNKLPMLNKIISFPTAITIDKNGIVRDIHTGFSGPGTGAYYEKYKTDFYLLMDKLLAE